MPTLPTMTTEKMKIKGKMLEILRVLRFWGFFAYHESSIVDFAYQDFSGELRAWGGPSSQQDEIGYRWAYVHSYKKIVDICQTDPVLNYADFQRSKWISHLIRKNNDSTVKQLLFETSQTTRKGRTTSILDQLLKVTRQHDMSDNLVYKTSVEREFVGELKCRDVEFVPRHHGDSEAD